MSCFLVVIAATLLITRWAARRASGREGFYAANGSISAGQNGLAIAGDFVSAATLLGTTGIYFAVGSDSLLYLVPFLLGLCFMLAWIAGPLRELGCFTLGDVMTAQLRSPVLRVYSGISTLVISLLYLVAQLVGAGGLISVLFGLSFVTAVIVVGALMAIYVTFGGMIAATWVQVIKASVLVVAILLLALLCVVRAGGLDSIYARAAAAHELGTQLFALGNSKMNLFSTISLVAGLAFGAMGLPHLLIRAFTVRDAAASRQSVAIGTAVIALMLSVIFFVIAPATVAFVKGVTQFQNTQGVVRGGANMAVVHLASALGGELLFGVIAAVAFATILAVVAGLTVAIASAASHDIYATLAGKKLSDEGHELAVFRITAIGASTVAVMLAIVLQQQNIAVLVAGAMVLAASANFPVLFLVIYWRGLTVAGAIAGGLAGLTSALVLLTLGPAVWVKVLGHGAPIFPSEYPTLITLPLAFLTAWQVSRLTTRNTVRPDTQAA
ncbi:MAG TPA: cation acetate symporter [Candidatus Paceibacterota bacterium]|nr:cation acetate symporter [Candidatus Paceibacterota bacterium]